MKLVNALIPNEEDLKVKVLCKFLEQIGFSSDEITLEHPFCVRLGTKKLEIQTVRGRADILCRRGDKNLFVVEVKVEAEPLNKEDIEQGCSYARLTHPITPFVVVTNGKQTRIIDTVTRKDLTGTDISKESVFWADGCTLALDDEFRYRYEALRAFIGYSPDNMRAFCSSQIESRMQPLKGGHDELDKKYLPFLFVPKPKIEEAFDEFLNSNDSCFALTGEAGVGKTNVLCALAERHSSDSLCLFFNCPDLVTDIPTSIRDDFSWFFSPQIEAPEIFRRLESLAGKNKACIFLDAIDESIQQDFHVTLNDFVRRAKEFPRVKLCLSCKSTEWHRFLRYQGSPTELQRATFAVSKWTQPDKARVRIRGDAGIRLERFSDDEIEEAEARYRAVFSLKGNFNRRVRDQCRLGFTLRVVAEVYRGRRLPSTINEEELLNAYLEKKFEKIHPDKELCWCYLKTLGSLLVDEELSQQSQSRQPGYSDEMKFREALRLSGNESLNSALFSHNVLSRRQDSRGRRLVGFYSTSIRDFVVSTHSLQLHQLSREAFLKRIANLMNGPIGQGALAWYARIANADHQSALLESAESRAVVFLSEYCRIIEHHFPRLRERFKPYTRNDIGLVLVNNLIRVPYYGFRPCNAESERVVECVNASEDDFGRLMRERGLTGLSHKGTSFFNSDPVQAAWEEVWDRVETLVNSGQLQESKNLRLAKEKVTSIAYNYASELGFPRQQRNLCLPRVHSLLPLRLADLRSRSIFNRAVRYFREKRYLKKSEPLLSTSRGQRMIPTYREVLTESDEQDAIKWARSVVRGEDRLPEYRVLGDEPPWTTLDEAIKTMEHFGIKSLEEPLLPSPDIKAEDVYDRMFELGLDPSWIHDILLAQFTDKRLEEYAQRYVACYLQEFRILVEESFPRLKERTFLYRTWPLEVKVDILKVGNRRNWSVDILYKKSRSLYVGVRTVRGVNPQLSVNPQEEGWEWRESISLDDFLMPDLSIPLEVEVNSSGANTMCFVRNAVYRLVIDCMPEIQEAFENCRQRQH